MATFSYGGTAKQLFVAKTLGAVTSASQVGTIDAVAGEAGTFHFQYKSPGGILRSDVIKVSNILKAQAIKATALTRGLKKVEVALDANVNGGSPITGQDYLLDFFFYEYGSLSYQEQYIKHAVVRGTSAMTAAKFYVELLKSAELNFSREQIKLLSFSAVTAGNAVYTYDSFTKTFTLVGTGTVTEAAVISANPVKLVIEEVEQPYVKGLKSSDPVKFNILPRTVLSGGEDLTWGTATVVTSTTTVSNGKVTADLEYFYAGERGDQYRNVGFPRVIPTEYLVDPTVEYHYIEIEYFSEGQGVDVQKQNKHITIVVPSIGADNATKIALVNNILGASTSAANSISKAAGSVIIAQLS